MKKELIHGAANKLAPLHVHLRDFSVSLDDNYSPAETAVLDLAQQGRHCPISVSMTDTSEDSSDEANTNPRYLYHFIYEVATRSLYPSVEESLTSADTNDKNPRIAMEILAKFDACYIGTEELEPEEVDEFAKYNVGFNVWPYWREFVGSVCSRIGRTPPISIPFYKMNEYQEEPHQLEETEQLGEGN